MRGGDFQWSRAVGALVLASLALLAVPSAVADPPPIKIQGLPEDTTVEATSPAGATLTWTATATSDTDGAVPVACSPDSGSTFPLGVTKVTCTASDSTGYTASKHFDVTVVDTTPPEVSVPSDITVPATVPSGAAVTFSASASDIVDGSLSASCSPPSGSTFAAGTTTVTCSATDSHGNTGTGSFLVTVQLQDTVPPTVFVPAPITVEATGPAGANVSFSASASDLVWGPLTPSCTPPSGSTFAVGTTTVNCSATDGSGNTGSASFSVTVRDTTPPVVTASPITAEATAATGAAVSFSASASDIVDGSIAASCSPPSGSTFAIGTTTVTCTATDSRGNTGSAGFGVTVQDTTAPAFSGVPSAQVIEADSPAGARASYTVPTASDAVDGGVPVSCSPVSGSIFGLGVSTVTCTATDAHANKGTASFKVTVQDTTKPALNVPVPAVLSSGGAPQLASTDSQVVAFLAAANASDVVDGSIPVTNDVPAVLPLGATTITFTATDQSGNTAVAQSKITVITGTAPPPNLDTTPPGEVRSIKTRAGDRFVDLTWTLPSDKDFNHLTVTRSPGKSGADATVVYSGGGKHLKDPGLKNGTEYRYVFVTFDATGNRSSGIAARATPKRALLLAPADGAVVTKPPVLRWVGAVGASYYNLQLYRLSSAAQFGTAQLGAKVLSVWPKRNQFALAKKWKYAGRVRRLTPGRYVWFVWPGLGPKPANKYGGLLGQSTFVVKAAR